MPAGTLNCPHCHKDFIPQVKVYQDDYILIDLSGFIVEVRGQRIRLTATEHRLLACLVANAGRILTHRQILSSVWGFEYLDDVDFVRVYIWHLRQKIEPAPANPKYIINENGLGYYFRKEVK